MSSQDNSSDYYLDDKGIKLHIFLKHRLELINYANNLIGYPHRAEDIVQEAFVKFDSASHSGVLKKPTAYLFRIVRNLAIDGLRKHIRESKVVCPTHEYENIADDTPTPEKIALYKSAKRAGHMLFICLSRCLSCGHRWWIDIDFPFLHGVLDG